MSPFKLIPAQNKHPFSKYVNALLKDQSYKFCLNLWVLNKKPKMPITSQKSCDHLNK